MATMSRASMPLTGTLAPWIRRISVGLVVLATACEERPQAVGGEVLATVAGRTITARDLASQRAYLSEFGELSFGDDESSSATLTRALVEATVMAEAGRREGLALDPRFAWAMREEDARLEAARYSSARAEPESGSEDEAALSQWHASNQAGFREPEVRAFGAVRFGTFKEARAAIAKLNEDPEARLSDFGDLLESPPTVRDDTDYPTVHPFIFAPSLSVGDVVQTPVISGTQILVAQIRSIEVSSSPSLDDPGMRERVVEAFEAARKERFVREYVETLRAARADVVEQ